MNGMENQGQSGSAACAAAVPAPAESAGLSTNAMAALGYFCGIGAVVALLIEPYNKNSESRFHAVQALLFQGTWIVGNIAFAICSAIIGGVVSMAFSAIKMGFLGVMVTGALGLVGAVLGLGMLAMWVYLIVAAANGKNPQVPKLAKIARSMATKT